MKDAISGMGLYIIVIAFIALFTTYVSVTTTYSRCFRIKDEIVTAIEHYRGINDDSLNQINTLLNGVNYVSRGECPSTGNWNRYEIGQTSPNAGHPQYCLAKYIVATNNTSSSPTGGEATVAGVGLYNQAYYQVVLFYKLNWPFLDWVFNIKISGETQVITNPRDTDSISVNNL